MNNPALYGQAWITYITLRSQANSTVLQTNPTLAAGDITVSVDGATASNVAFAVLPAGGTRVQLSLTAAQMLGDNISIVAQDQAGAEWFSDDWEVQPTGGWGLVDNGTAQAGSTSTTLVMRAAAVFNTNDLYGGVAHINGGTGAGQSRYIASNVGGTDTLTVDPAWTTTPDNTSRYTVLGAPPAPASGLSAISAAVFARTYDATKMNGLTFEELTAIMYSAIAAKVSGNVAGSASAPVFRNPGDTANVISATTDASGNRSVVTVTPGSVR